MVPVNVLRSIESTVPAFGMIGTLVGLVSPGSAVALNTTLYGELFARMILISAANKLQQREEILRFVMRWLLKDSRCWRKNVTRDISRIGSTVASSLPTAPTLTSR